jgi:2-polyprenyl-6-methoxyphenol hydroxylase-like FAD-dependent oxidoreductase
MASTWTVSDDVLDEGPERQVLVVGDGLVGRTVTALLQHCGYEPVLAVSDSQPSPPAVVHVAADAMCALETLDIVGQVRDRGTRIESVQTTHAETASDSAARSVETTERTPSMAGTVIDGAELRRALAVEWPLERARTDRAVRGVTSRPESIEVAFADGVRETFDAVVDTTETQAVEARAAETVPTQRVVQYAGRCDREEGASQVLREVWARGALVQVIPDATTSQEWVRVTTNRRDVSGLTEQPAVEAASGVESRVVADLLRSGGATRCRQFRLGANQLPSAVWGEGRIARCGGAAMPVAPALGSEFSLGVQDAVAFVSAIARHDHSTTAAIGAYAAARHRAISPHLRRARHRQSPRSPTELPRAQDSIAAFTVYRTEALDRVLDSPPEET